MNSGPIEFKKNWIDQYEAPEGIREQFGREEAQNYLIGEKLFSFLHAAERDPLFAPEMNASSVKSGDWFTAPEIRDYLHRLERAKYLAPQDVDLEPEQDLDEEEVWLKKR